MNPLYLRILGSLVRTALAAAGGAAWVSDNDLEQVIGAVGILVTLGWSIYRKWKAQQPAPARPTFAFVQLPSDRAPAGARSTVRKWGKRER